MKSTIIVLLMFSLLLMRINSPMHIATGHVNICSDLYESKIYVAANKINKRPYSKPKAMLSIRTAPNIVTFYVDQGNEVDNIMYTSGQELRFFIICEDFDGGFDYVNVTVNGSIWLQFVYTGTDWYVTVYMWDLNTLVPNFDNTSSATRLDAKVYLDPLKPNKIDEGTYYFNITAVNINGENSTEPLNVDYIVFDYTPPNVSIAETKAINSLDNKTKTSDQTDPTDKFIIAINSSDNFKLVNISVNYTRDYIHWEKANVVWNGTYYVASIPPQHPGNITYSVYAIDAAGNVKSISGWYIVHDPYEPIIYAVNITKGIYVDEEINISIIVVENANSSITHINCTIYQSPDNESWEILTTSTFEFLELENISLNSTVNGELEVWNNASKWYIAKKISYWTYLKIRINIYDSGGNIISTTKYIEIQRRKAEIIGRNISTRYGDDTNIVFCVIDLINDSPASLYFELYIDDELAYYGWTNSTGNTTIIHTFMDVRVFELRIYIPETQQYVSTEYVFYVTVLKEVLEPVFDLDALQTDSFRVYGEIRDDETNFVYGCEVWVFIEVSGYWYILASEIRDNPLEIYIRPTIELENGEYELWICIYGGDYYQNYNTTMKLYVKRTMYNKIYISNNTILGQNISGEYTVWDQDGIVNCSIEIYDPYGRKYEPYYNVSWINNTVVATKFEFELSIHQYPGTWWVWIWVTDGSGSTTIKKEKINVSDVSLLIVVKSPKNQTTYDTKTIDFLVEVYYCGVKIATGQDVIVNAIVLDMGISTTLSYDNGSGSFRGTIILSEGNHTIIIQARDERRTAEVIIIVGIPKKESILPYTVIIGLSTGTGLIIGSIFIKQKKKKKKTSTESVESSEEIHSL